MVRRAFARKTRRFARLELVGVLVNSFKLFFCSTTAVLQASLNQGVDFSCGCFDVCGMVSEAISSNVLLKNSIEFAGFSASLKLNFS